MQVKRKTDDYLAHHGVKGQRWGVRRYQNADGSLTEAGKKKYNSYYTRESKALTKREGQNLKNLVEYDKYRKQYEKKSEKYGEDSAVTKKVKKKMDSALNSYNAHKPLIDTELKAIKSYKLSDFMKEENNVKRAQAQNIVNSIITGATATGIQLAITGNIPYAVGSGIGSAAGYAISRNNKTKQDAKSSYRYKFVNKK